MGGGHRAQVRAGAAAGVHGLGVEQGADLPQRGTVLPVGLAVDRDGADVGRSSPMIKRIVVDLPAPFGPRIPVTVPGAMVKLRVCTAVLSP